MRIHYIQHVPFEGLANIELWARDKGHSLSGTQLFLGQELPDISRFDMLVIMGGPMNIYEETKYPWLTEEKRFVEKSVEGQKIVLGICLGAQLLADVLGGTVYKNDYKEIGWYPVTLTEKASESGVFAGLPKTFTAFHWHGDTFSIPSGAIHTASNECCLNQSFEYNKRVVGLQFHLECSMISIDNLITNCGDELVEDKFVQTAQDILSQTDNTSASKIVLWRLLDNIQI